MKTLKKIVRTITACVAAGVGAVTAHALNPFHSTGSPALSSPAPYVARFQGQLSEADRHPAALVGTSLMAWASSHSTGPGPQHANQARAFAPDEMHKTEAVRALSVQKVNDMSFVFADGD